MTALLLALFGGAAILAVASMIANIRHYAAAVIAMAHQHGGGEQPHFVQRKHLVYARRLKAQPGWRAKARARRAGRDLRRDSRLTLKHGNAPRKTVHNRHFGFSVALLSDTLAPE